MDSFESDVVSVVKLSDSTRDIAVLYPCESLARQMDDWCARRADCRVRVVRDRSAVGIRDCLAQADVAVVDATEDPAQAIDAFSQAVTGLGAPQVAVYVERLHDGVELFVRRQGALVLFGPYGDMEWDSFFEPRLALHSRRVREGKAA